MAILGKIVPEHRSGGSSRRTGHGLCRWTAAVASAARWFLAAGLPSAASSRAVLIAAALAGAAFAVARRAATSLASLGTAAEHRGADRPGLRRVQRNRGGHAEQHAGPQAGSRRPARAAKAPPRRFRELTNVGPTNLARLRRATTPDHGLRPWSTRSSRRKSASSPGFAPRDDTSRPGKPTIWPVPRASWRGTGRDPARQTFVPTTASRLPERTWLDRQITTGPRHDRGRREE